MLWAQIILLAWLLAVGYYRFRDMRSSSRYRSMTAPQWIVCGIIYAVVVVVLLSCAGAMDQIIVWNK